MPGLLIHNQSLQAQRQAEDKGNHKERLGKMERSSQG
jgi:hypothetical protein